MQKVKLGDICEKGGSNIAQKDVENNNGNYPIYGAAGLIKYVDFYQQEKEYIAVVKDGAGIGRAMKLPAKSSVIGTMQYIFPKENVSIDYLFYLLSHLNLAKYFSGATIPHIYFKDYKNEEVNLPSIEEQKAIAEKLDKVSSLIEKRKQQLSQLDLLVKSQFIEMFGDPFTTTEWDKKPLREVSVSIYDGSNIPKDLYCSTGSIVFYRIQNVWRNEYHLDDLVYISSGTSRIYSDSSLNTNDILITKIGRFYTKDSSLGRVALYKGETGKAHFSNNIMRIRLKAEVMGEYINALLNLDVYQAYIKKVSVGGTDKRALSKMIIGELPIPVPPIDLQKKFVALLEQTDKSKFRVKQSLAALELLKKSLMQKYFG